MATSSNGLKFMWLPGKKKHDRKGQYNTTKNYHNPYKNSNIGGQGQRKNEVWSMGGSRGTRSIINTDTEVFTGTSAVAAATVGPTTLSVTGNAVVAGTVASTSGGEVKPIDECLERSELNEENLKAANNKNECDDKMFYHNASTLVLGEKAKKSNGSDQDLDSIEQLNESKTDLNDGDTDGEVDVTDTASTQNLQTKHKKRKNRSKKKSKQKNKQEESKPEDDKFVACLYYSLVCCDCTIS